MDRDRTSEPPAKLLRPPHPERICWGCDNYCPADDLQCGSRTLHPVELEWSGECATGGEHVGELKKVTADRVLSSGAYSLAKEKAD